MMHDSYSQVASESKNMLVDCFPNGKYDIIVEKFKEQVCGIALKFVSGKHPLLTRYSLLLYWFLFWTENNLNKDRTQKWIVFVL